MTEHDKHEWYGVLNGVRIGPMTWETLRGRVRNGQLRANDLVWAAPFGDTWLPAGTVEGLFEAPPPPPSITPLPPPPPPPPLTPLKPPPPDADTHENDDAEVSGEAPSARRALQRIWRSMVKTLFQPFDIARWFSIGFCAWVALIGSGSNLKGLIDAEKMRAVLQGGDQTLTAIFSRAFEALTAVPLFTMAMLNTLIMGVALSVAFCWLRARGTFMFLHRLQRPEASISQAWRVAGETALPLFWWRIALGTLGWTALLATLTGAAFSIGMGLLRSGNWGALVAAITLPWAAVWGGALVTLLCVWGAIKSLSFHLMEPLLYVHKDGIGRAWLRVWAVCRDYPFAVMRFYLLLSLVLLAAGAALLLFLVCSCCLGAVLLLIPLVNAVVILPILWIHRGLGVAFLRQIRMP